MAPACGIGRFLAAYFLESGNVNNDKQFDLNKLRHFIALAEVMKLTGKSRSAIYADIKAKKFPPPVRTGIRSIRWPSDTIANWQEERIEASKAA